MIRSLGEGGMGSVWLAFDTHQGERPVALKMLRPEAIGPGVVDLFRREFRAMTRLRHPNLAEVYDFGTADGEGRHFLTMEYVPGRHFGLLPRREVLDRFDDLAVQILRALDYIHARGVLHNDIKPQNIQVRATYELKLLDFGLAHDEAGPAGPEVSGTVHYIAPERFQGGPADARSDLYSLGVVLYEALTGRQPFAGDDPGRVIQEILRGDVPPPRVLAPDLPERVEAFLLALLARAPGDRPSSAGAALDRLNRGRPEPLGLDTPETRASFVTTGRFVGRDAELDSLLDLAAAHAAAPGDDASGPRLILLRGPGGIGKSRLLRELRYRLQLQGIRNLTGRYYEDAGAPLEAVVEILRQAPGRENLPAPLWRVLERLLPSEAAAGRPAIAADAAAAGRPAPAAGDRYPGGPPRPDPHPETSKEEFIAAVADILDRLGAGEPGVLFLEDLHWCDAPGVLLLEHALLRAGRGPWLFIGTLRDEEAAAGPVGDLLRRAPTLERVRLMPLAPLTKEQVADLLASMVPFEERPDHLAGMLADRTDGNPLYLEELMKSLAEAGTLRRRGDAWVAESPALEAVRLPDSLASAVVHRLAGLPPPERGLAELLAVFNRPVPAPLLARAAGLDEERTAALLGALDRLRLAGVEPQRSGPPLASLSHSRIRDAIYGDIAQPRRRDLHREAGRALEEAHRDALDQVVEELAHHFASAGDRERAADYCTRAARRAMDLYTIRRAIRFGERALEFVPAEDTARRLEILRLLTEARSSDTLEPETSLRYARLLHDTAHQAGDAATEVHALRHQAWALGMMGDTASAAETARRGVALGRQAGALLDAAWCLNALGVMLARQGRHEEARGFLEEACDLADRSAASPGERTPLLANRALNLLGLGDTEQAGRVLRQVVDFTRERGPARTYYGNLANLGLAAGETDLPAAVRTIEEVVAWAREHGAFQDLTESLGNLVIFRWLGGRPDLAILAAREERTIRDHFADAAGWLPTLDWLGRIETGLGRPRDGIGRHEPGLETARELGDRRQEGFFVAALGADHAALGDAGRAEALGREAAAIGREIGHRRITARGLMLQAAGEAARGDRKAVAATVRALTRIEARYLRHYDRLDLHLALGRCALATGRPDDARREARAGIAASETGGFREHLWRFHALAGEAQSAKSLDEAARDSYNAALAVIRGIAADIEDAAVRDEYVNESRRREIGQRAAGTAPLADQAVTLVTSASPSGADAAAGAGRGDAVKVLTTVYEITQIINSILDLRELLNKVMDLAIDSVGAERGLVFLYRSETDEMDMVVARNMEHQTIKDAHEYSRSILKEVGRGRSILSVDAIADERFKRYQSVAAFQIRSLMCVPLRMRSRIIGTVYVDTRRPGVVFAEDDLRFLEAFANQAAIAIENARLYEQVRQENRYLREAVQERYGYENIVGRSARMREVFALLSRVSPTNLTVLIRGESGTGKELVARAIHHNSPRRDRRFFSENCAALTDTLLESELFGHVRGAFTGADASRKGLFELADGGTLFLDEVGDMSLAMQSKLLRVLQEGEIRPIGGETTRRVDVRIVSATNRDLEALVREKKFRQDLYFRLNVFSVRLPALRERRDDIPLLVDHFLAKLARDNDTPRLRVDPGLMALLTRYDWPGNVRELENQICKMSLFVTGEVLTRDAAAHDPEFYAKIAVTSRGVETHLSADDVRAALRDTGGNRERAADLLGVSRATLFRKLKQFRIDSRPSRPPRPPRPPRRSPEA
jgi:Nif-specific regulatory protein